MVLGKYNSLRIPACCGIMWGLAILHLCEMTNAFLLDGSFTNSWFVATIFCWCFLLNVTWCVNSAAHKFGGCPYDKSINPSRNPGVSLFAFGECWHNCHHVFFRDYKTSEWSNYFMNLTTTFLISSLKSVGHTTENLYLRK